KEVKKLTEEYQDKLKKLEDIKNKLRGGTYMELINNPKFVMIGEFIELKTRDEFKKELDALDKKVNEKSYTNLPSVLISYEVGFKESDITCFIGRVLSDDLKTNYGFIDKLQSMGLEVLTDNVVETLLHTSSNGEVIDA